MTFLASLRAAFFIVAIFAWDPSMGTVENYRSAFYSLDELSTVAFFSLTCALALFWAEIYYIAIDNVAEYTYFTRPVTYIINLTAYIVAGYCTYRAVHASTDASDYIYWSFSILVAILYLLAAVIFTFYAFKAAQELHNVPLQLATRQDRTEELVQIFTVFMVALVTRAVLLIVMSDDNLDTDSTLSIIGLTMYFFFLEFLPVVFACVFYRVRREGDVFTKVSLSEVQATLEESQPLNSSSTSNALRMSSSSEDIYNPSSVHGDFGNSSSQKNAQQVASLLDKLNNGML